MSFGEFMYMVYSAAVVYLIVGVGVFFLAGNGLGDALSRETLTYALYWPLILRDALSGYTPSF